MLEVNPCLLRMLPKSSLRFENSSDEGGLDPERLGDERLYFGRLMPAEWKFLFDWFDVVSGRFSVAERFRLDTSIEDLGRDKETDWWIHVQHENDGLVSRYDTLADKQLNRYRTVRESVMLLTIMARVDYTAWIAELRRASRFFPVPWSNIRQERVSLKYCFSFYDSGDDTDVYDWELLENAFSEQFLEDFPRACAVVKARGLDVAAIDPIPIKFRVKTSVEMKKAQQIALLKNLTKTVAHILEMEEARRRDCAVAPDGAPLPPVFRLESLEHDFLKFEFHSTVLKEVQRLVETGARISSLTLPSFGARHSRETDQTQRLNWGLFLCAISGQPQPPHKKTKAARPVRVERLVVRPVFPSKMWTLALCSALATARRIKAVKIEHRYIERQIEKDQSPLWAWMGYALFRINSSTSVETLELPGYQLTASSLDVLSETMRPQDGLEAVWHICTGQRVPTTTSAMPRGHSVVVKKGSHAHALGHKD